MNDYQSNNNNNKHILLLLKTEWRRGWRKSFKKINEIVFIHKCSSALRRWRWRVFVLAPRVIWTFVGFVFFTFCVFRKALSVKERNHMSMLSKYIPQISWLFLLPRHPLLLFCCCWWSVGMQHTYAAWRYLEKNTKKDYNNVDVVADLRSSFEVVQQHVCCLLLYMHACACLPSVHLFISFYTCNRRKVLHSECIFVLFATYLPPCLAYAVHTVWLHFVLLSLFLIVFVVVVWVRDLLLFALFNLNVVFFHLCFVFMLVIPSEFLLQVVFLLFLSPISLSLAVFLSPSCTLCAHVVRVDFLWMTLLFCISGVIDPFFAHTHAHTLLQLQLCVVCTPSVFYIWFCIPLHCYFSHLV